MAGLTLEELVEIAAQAVGPDVRVRDHGLLVAALARVESTVFDQPVYPTVVEKAAALLHSLLTTVPLAEGNRPFALAATLVFLCRNDQPLTLSDQEAVDLVTRIVTGRLEGAREIARDLAGAVAPAEDSGLRRLPRRTAD